MFVMLVHKGGGNQPRDVKLVVLFAVLLRIVIAETKTRLCENDSRHYDPKAFSELDCNDFLNFSKQHCNVANDEQWECLLEKARIQDKFSCDCFYQTHPEPKQVIIDQPRCMSVDFCVFLGDGSKCYNGYECIEVGKGRIQCSGAGLKTFFPNCSRSLLYCSADDYYDCKIEAHNTFEGILRDKCFTEEDKKHQVLYYIDRMHYDNSRHPYGNITAIGTNGTMSINEENCERIVALWIYIVSIIGSFILVSLCGYGVCRLIQCQDTQDKIWDDMIHRNNKWMVTFESVPTGEPLCTTTTRPETFDEIQPRGCETGSDAHEDNVQDQRENGGTSVSLLARSNSSDTPVYVNSQARADYVNSV